MEKNLFCLRVIAYETMTCVRIFALIKWLNAKKRSFKLVYTLLATGLKIYIYVLVKYKII